MKLLRTLPLVFFNLLLAPLRTGSNPLVHSNSPFSLADDVPFEKQQELLQVWPISEGYIRSLDASVGPLNAFVMPSYACPMHF